MNTHIFDHFKEWQMTPQSSQTMRLVSPHTFGEDGMHIAFTVVFPTPDTFALTDHMAHMLYVTQTGAKYDKRKIQQLNHTHGIRFAQFDEYGEIMAQGSLNMLPFALSDALKLALSLSFKYPAWLPKFDSRRFRELVKKTLLQQVEPSQLLQDYPIMGMSGHEIIFPFAIQQPHSLCAIDTIALEHDKLSWKNVYQTFGKFSDIKKSNKEIKRLAIMEVDEEHKEWGASLTLLADVAHIQTLNHGLSLH